MSNKQPKHIPFNSAEEMIFHIDMSNILTVTEPGVSVLTFIATSEVTNADCNLIPTELVILSSSDIDWDVGKISSL